jgi:hypothetical protein
MIDDWERSQELAAWIGRLTLPIVIWLIAFPVWATLFPSRTPKKKAGTARDGG